MIDPNEMIDTGAEEGMSNPGARVYGIITAVFFTVSIAYAVRYGYGMLLPGMLADLQITKTEAGVISATYFAAYTISSPIVGLLSDRANPRLIVTLFTFLLAVGTILMGFVSSVVQASLVFGLVGIGHAACWAPVVSLVQQWVSDEYRGTALAVATTGSGIGIAAWSMWLPMVVESSSSRTGWIQMGLFGLFVAVLNFILIRKAPSILSPSEVKAEHHIRELWSSYRSLLGSKPLWIVGISYSFVGFAVLVPFTFLNVYATQELQMDYRAATRFFTVLAVAGIVGKFILGTLSDRWGRIPVMAICGILLGTGCLLIIVLPGFSGKMVGIIMVGLGFDAVWPVYAAAAVDFFPRSQAGSVIGLWTVFLGVGSILSPVVCGWSIDITSSYTPAFLLGFLSGLLAVLVLISLRTVKR